MTALFDQAAGTVDHAKQMREGRLK